MIARFCTRIIQCLTSCLFVVFCVPWAPVVFNPVPSLCLISAQAQSISYVQGTYVTLYDKPNYLLANAASKPLVFQPVPQKACYNLPVGFSASLGSGVVQWNVKDVSKNPHYMCTVVWFFAGPDCSNGAIGLQVPGGAGKANPSLYNYADTKIATFNTTFAATKSIACSYTPDPCKLFGASCPANSVCKSYPAYPFGGTTLSCVCNAGLSLSSSGTCVDACATTACGENQACKIEDGAATCVCKEGFARYLGKCVQNFPGSPWLIPHNEARAAVGSGELSWSTDLAVTALAWVNEIAGSECKNVSRGSNLLRNVVSFCCDAQPSTAVGVWVGEKPNYSYNPYPKGCVGNAISKCIHYLRVVWKTSPFVGCASKTCSNGFTVAVCDYSEKSLVNGAYPY